MLEKDSILTSVAPYSKLSGSKQIIRKTKILYVDQYIDILMIILKVTKHFQTLESCLSTLANENKEVYICSNFDSDWLKTGDSTNYKLFFDQMFNYGYYPFITLPTRVQGNAATVIDNIFTKSPYHDTVCWNITTDFSDHFSQFASIPRGAINREKKLISNVIILTSLMKIFVMIFHY